MDSQDSANKLMQFVNQQQVEQANRMSADDARKAAIIGLLGALGATTVGDDSIVFEGDKLILPATFEGNVLGAVDYLKRYHTAMEKHYEYNRTFQYRPWDGANAFHNVMMKLFGSAGLGKNRPETFFSPERPPVMETINVGVDQTTQIPWGEVELPQLDATFGVTGRHDPEMGDLFHLTVDAPKKYKRQIEAFYAMVEKELREHSIYRGKAITGAKSPTYIDTSKVDPDKVVYSEEVMTQLTTNLWSRLRYTEQYRTMGIDLKRAVLVEGPYGTGKTLAGMLTAQEAIANGWTFLLCRSGQDNLFEVLQTAQLYAPAVVWFEDIDVVASNGDEAHISKLLDLLDGVQGKGAEVVAGFTTNFVENLQKGVLRPGRIDAIVHIGELDAGGYQKLIKSLVKPELLGEIDYEKVQNAFAGFLPAFVAEAIKGALAYALTRNAGKLKHVKINTDDLIDSSLALRPQLDLMNGAKEGANLPTMDSVLTSTVSSVLNKTVLNRVDTKGQRGLFVDDEREPLED